MHFSFDIEPKLIRLSVDFNKKSTPASDLERARAKGEMH
jgi:hypothetical protein